MFTYKVVSSTGIMYQVIEAEYFTITSDGFGGNDAYFYVCKPVETDTSRVKIFDPQPYEEVLVGYAQHPQFVQLSDNFVYQGSGNNNLTSPLTYPPGVR